MRRVSSVVARRLWIQKVLAVQILNISEPNLQYFDGSNTRLFQYSGTLGSNVETENSSIFGESNFCFPKKITPFGGVMRRVVKWTSTDVDCRPAEKGQSSRHRWLTSTKPQKLTILKKKIHFLNFKNTFFVLSTSTAAFFSVDGRQPFSSRPSLGKTK